MPSDSNHMKNISKLPRQTKLTFDDRKFIAASPSEPLELAKQFNVSTRTIYRYKSRPMA